MTFSRREFVRLVAQLVGLGAGVGAAAVAKAEPNTVIQDSLKNLIEAMGIVNRLRLFKVRY